MLLENIYDRGDQLVLLNIIFLVRKQDFKRRHANNLLCELGKGLEKELH